MRPIPIKLYRQAIIYQTLRRNVYINLSDLIQRVQQELEMHGYVSGISQRSIQRDMQEMNQGWVSILYDRQRNGYYIPEDEVVDAQLEELTAHIVLLTTLRFTQSLTNYVLPEQREMIGVNYLPMLIPVLEKNLIIEFNYQKFSQDQVIHHAVESYFLKEFSGRWYLLGKENNGSTMKIWGLDRIRDLVVTQKHFQRDPQFNPQEYYKNNFGIYISDELPVEEIILSFTPKAGQYLLTRPLHSSQVTLINNDKEVRIKVNLKLTNDLIMELLSQTDKMTVVAPQHLKERFQNIYQRAICRMNEIEQ